MTSYGKLDDRLMLIMLVRRKQSDRLALRRRQNPNRAVVNKKGGQKG